MRVLLTVAKHIRIGNYIKLSSGEEGYLVDIDWRASRLRQLTNNTVLVPNAKFSQSIVTNYHSPEHEMVVTFEASVDYKSDLDRVEAITIEVARDVMRTVQGGVPNFEPVVRFHTFGDPGIGFSVILRAQEYVDQFLIKHEFVKRLHKRFAAEDIAIPLKSIAQRNDDHATAVKAFYYGWVVLLVAAAAMVGTLPGRTQGLGLVTEPLLADLGIGRVDYAQLNLWATLIGAAGAIGIGRFIDRFGSRVVLVAVAAALGVTVVLMSRVTTFAGLAVAVTLTSALGQSALSVVSIAMVGQWFVRRIDMAMAIYSVVLSVGFMIAFPVVGSLVQSSGWRTAWFAVGAAILAGLVPLALLFVRRNPESIGLAADGDAAAASALPVPGSGSNAERGTRNAEPGTARLNARRGPAHARLLGVCRRRRALWTCRIWHRLVQRIDPRGERIRTERVLPDARRHGDHRPRRKFHRRLARAVRAVEPSDGRVAVGAGSRPPRAAAHQHTGDGDGMGGDDGPRRGARDGAVLQRLAALVRTASAGTHPGRRASDDRARVSRRAAAACGVCRDDGKLRRDVLHSCRDGRRLRQRRGSYPHPAELA